MTPPRPDCRDQKREQSVRGGEFSGGGQPNDASTDNDRGVHQSVILQEWEALAGIATEIGSASICVPRHGVRSLREPEYFQQAP